MGWKSGEDVKGGGSCIAYLRYGIDAVHTRRTYLVEGMMIRPHGVCVS